MADEIAKRDENRIAVLLGITNDSAESILMLRLDPSLKTLLVTSFARIDTPETFEDTSFVSGDSPVTLDANAALGRNATEFSIQNDGPGNFTVSLSTDSVAFGDEKTVFDGEVYAIDNISVDSIRITHVADSAYRVTVL